jgi:hypothetical protein
MVISMFMRRDPKHSVRRPARPATGMRSCCHARSGPAGMTRRVTEAEAELVTCASGADRGVLVTLREACAFCLQRRNLRRTLGIAAVVGVLLTVINQGGVIAAGHATTATWVRCALNFLVPFLVSNAGLLSGRR